MVGKSEKSLEVILYHSAFIRLNPAKVSTFTSDNTAQQYPPASPREKERADEAGLGGSAESSKGGPRRQAPPQRAGPAAAGRCGGLVV